jgi:hypothetical protein
MNDARRRGHRVYAALYDRMTGPLEQGVFGTRRSGLLAGLPGEVLDVGAGTGANLPHFRSASRVVGPGPAHRRCRGGAAASGRQLRRRGVHPSRFPEERLCLVIVAGYDRRARSA